MRVLIAEDEPELARGLKFLLEKNKFSVDTAKDGTEALDYFHSTDYDVIVLDIMMPKVNGLDVLRQIRESGAKVPVMMLTAKAEIEDRVAGLEAGADDYLPKPFASLEFIARVKALSRRNAGYTDLVHSFGNVRLDCNRYELYCGDRSVRLNNKEFQLMELFMRHPGYVFSANHLMERIWGQDAEADINVVWTYIGFIRRKLKEIGSGAEIRTVRGAGYMLKEAGC